MYAILFESILMIATYRKDKYLLRELTTEVASEVRINFFNIQFVNFLPGSCAITSCELPLHLYNVNIIMSDRS